MEDETIQRILTLLNEYELQDSKQHNNLKKWISRLVKYAISDKNYKNKKKKYWSFARGSIIKVDLGFNVGYELGGVHYAVVITKNDSIYSGTINVIPLTSKKDKKLQITEVDLGDEFYDHIDHAIEVRMRDLNTFQIWLPKIEEELELFKATFKDNDCIVTPQFREEYSSISLFLLTRETLNRKVNYQQLFSMYSKNLLFVKDLKESLTRTHKEISYMKPGTIAKVDQFRVISKNRIVNPKQRNDALNKIKFFESTLDKLNEKLNELFIF